MSIRIMSMVFDASGMTSTQKLVMLALADHANEEGKSIYPSVQRVCDKTALGERVVRRTLSELRGEDVGLIRVVRKSKFHSTTEYAINVKNLRSLVVERPALDAPLESERPALNAERPALNAPKSSVNHQTTDAVKKTDRARPDERAILTAFCEESGIPEPHPNTMKENKSAAALWWQPIRRMCGLANGRGPDLARQAVRRLRHDRLTVSSPASIEKTFTALFSEAAAPRTGTPEL